MLLVQEHWLVPSRLGELSDLAASVGFACVSSSAMATLITSGMVIGRPSGGLAIFFRLSTVSCVARIRCGSDRVLAANCRIGCRFLRVINAYLPFNAKVNASALAVFNESLTFIGGVAAAPGCDLCLLAGDFNVDFVRGDELSRDVYDCLADCGLKLVDTLLLPAASITYSNPNGGVAWLDHCAISAGVPSSNIECRLVEPPGPGSLHCALVTVVAFAVGPSCRAAERAAPPAAEGPDWERASREDLFHYELAVRHELDCFGARFPFDRAAPAELPPMLQAAVFELSRALLHAAASALPLKRPFGGRGKSWWSSALEAAKQRCVLAHSLWISAGRPCSGVAACNHHLARSSFKRACRAAQRASSRAGWDALSGAAAPKRFWRRAAALRGATARPAAPEIVDFESSSPGIAGAFAARFAANCKPWDTVASEAAGVHFQAQLTAADSTFVPFGSDEVVRAITSKLKLGKAADLSGLSGEHLRFAGAILPSLLAPLFSAMVLAANLPASMAASVFTPLLKSSRLDAGTSASYRGIAVAPTLSRVLEALLLARWAPYLVTDERQFAYKAGGSSAACVNEVLGTVEHFRRLKTPVHMALLDASCAFDKVLQPLLGSKLLARGCPAAEVKMLCAMLAAGTGVVRFGGVISAEFKLDAGVRQGSLLGGVLWAVYVDELLQKLRASGLGCRIGGRFLGVSAYADDICLLSPTASGMQLLLNICDSFAVSHQVRLNPAKSAYLFAGWLSGVVAPCLKLAGLALGRTYAAKYLGYSLVFALSGRLFVDAGPLLRAFFCAANSIAAIPGAGAGALRVRLLAAYATPFSDMLLMVAEHLPPRGLLAVGQATCRALRRVLGLHRACSGDLACAVAGWVPPDCRAGQMILRPGFCTALPGRGMNVAALRAAGITASRAAWLVFLTGLDAELLPRACALRGLLWRVPGDHFARVALLTISTPSALRASLLRPP